MTIEALLEDRLILVTGKGGTGKTSYAAALAAVLAAKGRRTLFCEVDVQQPASESIFGVVPSAEPKPVHDGLDVCNLVWPDVFATYLTSMVRIPGIARMVMGNSVLMKLIDFTPGSQELVVLSVMHDLVDRYDVLVVDMPASGHAFSMLDITRSAASLFRSGPIRNRADELIAMIRDARTRLVYMSLPEDMVVNETLELHTRMQDAHLVGGRPMTVINRATVPSLSQSERELLARMDAASVQGDAAAYLDAGRWEADLEKATWTSLERLTQGLRSAPLLMPTVPEDGSPAEIVRGIAVALGRYVGVGAEEFAWT